MRQSTAQIELLFDYSDVLHRFPDKEFGILKFTTESQIRPIIYKRRIGMLSFSIRGESSILLGKNWQVNLGTMIK
jgi:hypothetical protein